MVLTPYYLMTFKKPKSYGDKPTEKIVLSECITVKAAEEECKSDLAFVVET